jgi:hypothetical protein
MDPITLVQSVTLLDIFKVMILLLLAVYTIFALLMMKQVGAMTRAVMMKDDAVIRILGIIHFVFALGVFVIALLIL